MGSSKRMPLGNIGCSQAMPPELLMGPPRSLARIDLIQQILAEAAALEAALRAGRNRAAMAPFLNVRRVSLLQRYRGSGE